jgi:hypothetical protein
MLARTKISDVVFGYLADEVPLADVSHIYAAHIKYKPLRCYVEDPGPRATGWFFFDIFPAVWRLGEYLVFLLVLVVSHHTFGH